MPHIYLVRHGQTDWNKADRFMGQQDVPLNDQGRNQAVQLSQRLQIPWAQCFSSDLSRCSETAAILLGGVAAGSAAAPEPALREIRGGQFEGLTREEQQRQFPAWHATRSTSDDPDGLPFPGGESFRELKERSVKALTRAAKSGGPILAVTHGGVIHAVLAHILDLSRKQLDRLELDNCGVTIVDWNGPHEARILQVNG